jgi:hypothetical protein
VETIPEYVLHAAYVVDELRLLYVPVPKAGSTALLGALAGVVGIRPDDLAGSRKLEATRSLAIHDGSLWGPSTRLDARSEDEQDEILRSEEWLRLTVVREPARRLWSAWVSKVLVRDPRFVASFDESLFPPIPTDAGSVLDSFRAFVQGLSTETVQDVHWLPQAGLVEPSRIRYHHVGRVEAFERTTAVLATRLREAGFAPPTIGHENAAILPFVPELFDRPTLIAASDWTASDRAEFGYELLEQGGDAPDARWFAAVDAALPAVQAVTERNERIGDLAALLAEPSGWSLTDGLSRWAARRT